MALCLPRDHALGPTCSPIFTPLTALLDAELKHGLQAVAVEESVWKSLTHRVAHHPYGAICSYDDHLFFGLPNRLFCIIERHHFHWLIEQ